MIIGRKDALSLVAAGAGFAAASPLLAGSGLAAPFIAASALGSGALTWNNAKHWLNRVDTKRREGFVLPSDKLFGDFAGADGLRLGYTCDNSLPLDVSNQFLMRHTAIIGQSGVGKTTLGEFLLWQQMARGGGFMFIDAKLDVETRDKLAYMARILGRGDEFYVLNVDDPANSHTYNPLLNGDADEVASRLLNLLPASENNIGADFYKQQAAHALTVIIGALKKGNYLYHFGDLSISLQSARAIESLERLVPADSPERRSLRVFLDNFRRKAGKEGVQVDINKLKEVLGGMSGRIAMFAQGKFGQVFNTYTPEIDLTEIILNNKMLYVMLPSMAKDQAALNLGKMLLSDLRSAVYQAQATEKHKRPNPPFMAFLDEMGSYVMAGIARLFEQARSANICLVPAFQSFANLSTVGPDFADMVIQNTWNKIFFKFGSKDSPKDASDIIGEISKYAKTFSRSHNESISTQILRTNPQTGEGAGDGVSESWREQVEYRVTPDQLKALGIGEAVIVSGPRLFHVRTPMLKFPDAIPKFEAVRHPTFKPADAKELRFEERYSEFLMHSTSIDKPATPGDSEDNADD